MSIKNLYRYTTISKVERVITHNELYFASPNSFNDPFDSRTSFNYKNCIQSDVDKLNEFALQLLGDKLSSDKLKKEKALELIQKGKLIDLVKRSLHESLETINSKVGILCLSEIADDILMWSHYADGHQGLALQFDFTVINSIAKKLSKVEYTNAFPTLSDWLTAL